MTTNDEYLHIDSDVHVRTGVEAKAALEKENDADFVSGEQGIIRVTPDRWKKAQAAEEKHWMQIGGGARNDRNDEHMRDFESYAVLCGRSFAHAVELGCGPFTNLRLIADVCRVNACTLLDPLIDSYQSHPNVTYDRKRLFLDSCPAPAAGAAHTRPFRLHALRRLCGHIVRSLSGRTLPIRRLLATPIELMPEDERYDLVVMINVLEHCFDAERVLQKILSITEPGAVFVFHDKCYEHETVAKRALDSYDAAHPLRVDQRFLQEFFARHFTPLYARTKDFQYRFRNEMIKSQGLYYIGVRK